MPVDFVHLIFLILEKNRLWPQLNQQWEIHCLDIFGDGDGGWLLEVIDEFGNSTVWDDSFSSDQEALAEALDTIDGEGIESLIGSPSQSANQ